MLFCPHCGTLLVAAYSGSDELQFQCSTCMYVCPLTSPHRTEHKLQPKNVDDILGGDEAWKNVPETDAVCPECNCKQVASVDAARG